MNPEQNQNNNVARRFGDRLKIWRKIQNLPMKHIASDLGVSIQVVSDWERGVRFPCEKHLAQLESYTGTPLCWFFRLSGERCPSCETNQHLTK